MAADLGRRVTVVRMGFHHRGITQCSAGDSRRRKHCIEAGPSGMAVAARYLTLRTRLQGRAKLRRKCVSTEDYSPAQGRPRWRAPDPFVDELAIAPYRAFRVGSKAPPEWLE